MEGPSIFGIYWLIPSLLALAAALLGLVIYGWRRRRKITAEIQRMEAQKLSPEDELKTLGIVAVRQLDERLTHGSPEFDYENQADDLVRLPYRSEEAPQSSPESAAIVEEQIYEDGRKESADDVQRFAPSRRSAPVDGTDSVSVGRHPGTYLNQGSPLWKSSDAANRPDAVAFLLESLWAAMNAQSVALLRFDKRTSVYKVDALVSERVMQQISLFPTDGNVLNEVPEDTSIAILEPGAFNALRYHADPVNSVGHAAAIVVPGLVDRILLVADVERDAIAFGKQSLERLGDYADLLAGLLPKGQTISASRNFVKPANPAEDVEAVAVRQDAPKEDVELAKDTEVMGVVDEEHGFVFDASAAERVKPDIKKPTFDPPQKRNGSHRPRNEIVADEMAAARQVQEPLALALVVPRNAEEISVQGSRAIATAEEELMERLQNVAGSARVERFGELVMGVFSKAGPAFVEAWVDRVETSEGPDLQIGVALLRARHRTPEAFRADAETALHAAYTRQEDCVIVD